jgi:hypothetical protein
MGVISEKLFHSTLPLGCHHSGEARVLWIVTPVAPQWKGAMKKFFRYYSHMPDAPSLNFVLSFSLFSSPIIKIMGMKIYMYLQVLHDFCEK